MRRKKRIKIGSYSATAVWTMLQPAISHWTADTSQCADSMRSSPSILFLDFHQTLFANRKTHTRELLLRLNVALFSALSRERLCYQFKHVESRWWYNNEWEVISVIKMKFDLIFMDHSSFRLIFRSGVLTSNGFRFVCETNMIQLSS